MIVFAFPICDALRLAMLCLDLMKNRNYGPVLICFTNLHSAMQGRYTSSPPVFSITMEPDHKPLFFSTKVCIQSSLRYILGLDATESESKKNELTIQSVVSILRN